MSSQPQRDIEQELLAYKQRRREQLATPLELHPATRKMLQSEAARTTSRPLLTSDAAAKNFVRSFVMSHQQPGFFARHKQRVLWGGAMFACLAVVLAVLRNNPQQAVRQSAFPDTLPAPATDKFQELAKHPAAPANPRPTVVASAPQPAVQREPLDRRSGGGSPPVPSASAPAPIASLVATKAEQSLSRARVTTAAGVGGGAVTAASLADSALQRPAAPAVAELAPARQRFLQLDHRAGYRQNFNSPPVPQVMQDFAFERSGDRVRIVDADGSTYEGTVTPAPAEVVRAKSVSQLAAAKDRKDALAQQTQSADPQTSYRFFANGVNRKLNQSVEFRGEWQAVAPAQPAPATPALQAASFGAARFEAQVAEKKEKALATNALSDQPAPAKAYLFMQQPKEQSQGRISGRALVGGKNEFDIHAVPK